VNKPPDVPDLPINVFSSSSSSSSSSSLHRLYCYCYTYSCLSLTHRQEHVVVVQRTEEVIQQRKELPIMMEEHTIMEAIRANSVHTRRRIHAAQREI
jgi:hypothetical protein